MFKCFYEKLIYPGALWLLLTMSLYSLTLQQAEEYAVTHAPEIQQLQSTSDALKQSSIARGALDDPKLSFGVANLPLNDFSFTQSEMTQIQVGLMQQLPKGRTLSIRSEQEKIKASVYGAKLELMQLDILKIIRQQWLSLYYWQEALSIYQQEKKLFSQLTETTKALLANNQIQQKDVVRARLELSQADQNILMAKQQISEIEGQLSRWLNVESDQLNTNIPDRSIRMDQQMLLEKIKNHPLLKVDRLESEVSQKDIELSEQQYYPGFNVGVVYGFRQGNNMVTGQPRSDFIGAQVTMDLPVFTSNLQDRQVEASTDHYASMKAKAQADYQLLSSQLKTAYANWQLLSDQHALYQDNLVPEAKMYANSTEVAYQNKQTDFPTLVLAYLQNYNTRLSALETQVKLFKSQINLMYLQGK